MREGSESEVERMLREVVENERREVFCDFVECPPGLLFSVPVRKMGRRGLMRRMRAIQRSMNQMAAELVEVMAVFAETAEEPRGVAKEVSLGLAISRHAAENQIGLAQALMTRLPETFKAMQRGEIDAYKASKIAEPTAVLTDEQAREVDAIMAKRIGRKDPTALRRSTNAAVAKVDPGGYAERCRKRREERRVELIPRDDGMVQLSSHLPVEIGVAGYARIDREAHRRRRFDKTRTLDQHRADAFADLLLKNNQGVTVSPKAEVFIYMDFWTWLNLNTKPAEMAGQGLIPAWLANEIADGENTTLRRLITDPDDGQLISVGRNSYRPPAPLARLAHTRDRECRSPGCHRPAQVSELDHVDDWHAKTGETAEDNLSTFCAFDHHLKDIPGWSYTMDKQTGRITITTPTGDQYTSDPKPLHEPRTNPLPEPDPPF